MKIPFPLAIAGLAISFPLPAFTQEKDTTSSRIVQQRDLLGEPKSIDKFGELLSQAGGGI